MVPEEIAWGGIPSLATQQIRRPVFASSPFRPFLYCIIIIFLAELFVSKFMEYTIPEYIESVQSFSEAFGISPGSIQAIVNALLVLLIVSPFLWEIVVQPLRTATLEEMSRAANMFSHSHDVIVTFDEQGMIESANPAARVSFGHEIEDILGMPLMTLLPMRYREIFTREMETIRGGEQSGVIGRRGEMSGLKKNGEEFPIDLSVTSWLIGKRRFFYCIIRDISEQKRAEEAMRQRGEELERFNRELAREIAERKRAEEEMAVMARLATTLAECSSSEDMQTIVKEVCEDLFHPDAYFFAVRRPEESFMFVREYLDIVDGKKTTLPSERWNLESASSKIKTTLRGQSLLINRAHGDLQYEDSRFGNRERLSESLMYVPVKKGTTVIGVLSAQSYTPNRYSKEDLNLMENVGDIVAPALIRAFVEEELARRVDELARSNAELEQFAYVASHDLQEPLRKIQAFGDRLNTKCRTDLSETGVEYLDRMLSSVGRMRGLINDLLEFSRCTDRARPFQPVNLNNLLKEVIADLEITIQKAGGEVIVENLPALRADPVQMARLFQNLISNSMKFRRNDAPPVVRIHSRPPENEPAEIRRQIEENGFFRIFVEDNGIGFDDKYAPRIFEIFQRLHGRAQYEGSGMGLAICRKIMERHNGHITGRGNPGQGATFILLFPDKLLKGES